MTKIENEQGTRITNQRTNNNERGGERETGVHDNTTITYYSCDLLLQERLYNACRVRRD